MKLGVCRGLDDFDAMKVAKETGIDFWECGFGSLAKFDDEKFNQCKETLDSLHIPCIAANGFIPGDLKVVGESVDYPALCDYLDKGFERAMQLGVKKVVFGSGAARSFPDGFSYEKAKEQLVYFLSEYVYPKAQQAGCIVVMEPLRFGESKMIHTVADGVEIARMSGKSNIFGLADLYHVYGNNDSVEGIADYKDEIKHIHIAEPEKRIYPGVDDGENAVKIYKSFLLSAQKAGCETCSVEAHTEDFLSDIKNAISLLRGLID